MRSSTHWLIACITLVVIVTTLGLSAAQAQVYVYPRRPGQTNVRYADFDWSYVHIWTDPGASVETTDSGPRGGADLVEPSAHVDGSVLERQYPRLLPSVGTTSAGPLAADGEGDSSGSSSQASRDEEASNRDGKSDGDDDASDDEPSKLERLKQEAGGLRLYYYKDEQVVAERASATIRKLYQELMLDFDFAPPQTFPFILYNSYNEFLQTNLFPVQEGVLGVTSPRSLELTLPYFGDHRQFERVAKHELVHEFTIQKIKALARDNQAFRSPVQQFPLWFIEGLAEYYTHDGRLDQETRMLVRDLLVHPAPRRGYVFEGFFRTRLRGFLGVYKLGQAKCTFLEETYGEGTLQEILDQSYRLGLGRSRSERVSSFQALVEQITGDNADTIAEKFEEWIKKDSYETYLDASQQSSDLERPYNTDRYIQAFDTSSSGHLLAYKAIDRSTGQNELFVADYRDGRSETKIVADGRPGVESLHPLANRNFDVTDRGIVYIARAKGRDRLHWQTFSHSRKGRKKNKKKSNDSKKGDDSTSSSANVRARIRLDDHTRYDLGESNIMAAEAPAVSPDGKRVAFIGMDEEGQKDVFVLTPGGGGDFDLQRLTDDVYAERGLDWRESGLVYASDATGHGKYNLFELDPQADAEPTRLTSEPRDHLDPVVLSDGTAAFVAYAGARAHVYTVDGDQIHQKTSVSTGLFNPSPGPDGSLWALHHKSGRRRPARLPAEDFQTVDSRSKGPTSTHPGHPTTSLEGSQNYSALKPWNWSLDNGFGLLGVSGSGIYGQLFASASDQLRDHRLLLQMIALGSFRRTDGSLTYINQSNRLVWGLSAFHHFNFRADETFEDIGSFISNERFYGARGILRYPFNRFAYLQFDLAAGGVSYFLSDGAESFLDEQTREGAATGRAERWKQLNDGPRFQTEASVSLGFDTIKYQRQTGPLSGGSVLASVTGDYQPFDDTVFGQARLDGEFYVPIYRRINAFFRTGTGASIGGRLARQFYLSSSYTLRGAPLRDRTFLLGRRFFFSTLELQFPINYIVRVPFVDLEGIVGTDFGGVGDTYPGVWDNRIFNLAFGVNVGLGPLVLRVHFAKPFDIGAIVPNDGDIVPNITFGWRYL